MTLFVSELSLGSPFQAKDSPSEAFSQQKTLPIAAFSVVLGESRRFATVDFPSEAFSF